MNDSERDAILIRLDEQMKNVQSDVAEIKELFVPIDRFRPIERFAWAVGLTVITSIVTGALALGAWFVRMMSGKA